MGRLFYKMWRGFRWFVLGFFKLIQKEWQRHQEQKRIEAMEREHLRQIRREAQVSAYGAEMGRRNAIRDYYAEKRRRAEQEEFFEDFFFGKRRKRKRR